MGSTATPETWQHLLKKAKQTKEQLNHNIILLQNPQILKVIQNRRNKRKRIKANKIKLKRENQKKLGEWKQKEVEIDIWRERIIKKEKDEWGKKKKKKKKKS